MNNTRLNGRLAEERGHQYLLDQGLVSLARNFSCRHGEIDLIMRDQKTLVFVEVRYRGPGSRAQALETIDHKKQKRLRATALNYLVAKRLNPDRTHLRFDVLAMQGTPPDFTINWIRNALD